MKTITGRSLSLIAALLVLFTVSIRAEATPIITLAAAPSTDLSNVHVGDTLYFVSRGSTDVDPAIDEHFVGNILPVHLFADLDIFDVFSFLGYTGIWHNNLHSNPNLVVWLLQPNAAGTVTLYNGFSDCNGLANGDPTGCAITNLGASRPADSNSITFTIYDVPEPSSIAILGLGLIALGYSRRKTR